MDYKSLAIGAVIGILSLPVALYLALRVGLWFIKRKLRQIVESLPQHPGTPISITLDPLDTSHIDPRPGMQSIGAYDVREMMGVRLQAWLTDECDCFVIQYSHPTVGQWWDVSSHYEDGTTYCYTSGRESGMKQRPGHPNIKMTGASLEQLLQAQRIHRPANPKTLVGADFVPHFQTSYREEMEWRATRGTSREEIVAVAALGEHNYSDEVIEVAMEEHLQQQRSQLEEHLRAVFRRQSDMSEDQWEEVEDGLAFLIPNLDGGPDAPPLVLGDAPAEAEKVVKDGRRLGDVEIAAMTPDAGPTKVPVYFWKEPVEEAAS